MDGERIIENLIKMDDLGVYHHFRKPPSGTGERSDVATNGEATRVVVDPYEVKATRRTRWAF